MTIEGWNEGEEEPYHGRRLLRRYTIASFACMTAALACVLLLGIWGAAHDVKQERIALLKSEVAVLKSHAERTVGHFESQLLEGSVAPDFHGLQDASWLRTHWKREILHQEKWAYAAIEDATGKIAAHSNPAMQGGRLAGEWYQRIVTGVGGDVVETRFADLTEGRPAFDIRLPIAFKGNVVGTYHSGLNADWFEDRVAAERKNAIFGWAVVIGGVALVVLLAVGSLSLISRQSAALQRRVERADVRRMKDLARFIVGVTHEVRNPLNTIRLNLHSIGRVLRRDVCLPDAELAAMLRESVREIDRVAALVREMLGYAVGEPYRAEDIDLNDEVRGALDLVKRLMEEDYIAVVARLPSDPARVRIDRACLRKVLLNLLDNAREAVGKGGKIEVEVTRARNGLELAVTDNGPGVPPARRERIFEPFCSGQDVGIGLGLAQVKKFVEEGGGEIAYRAVHDGGSRFVVHLPEASVVQVSNLP
ncbi:MAG TPA: ATP-binding protein [Pirellulales bacterium]|nr:ATP-binding protein [Pirellulales bacterium]